MSLYKQILPIQLHRSKKQHQANPLPASGKPATSIRQTRYQHQESPLPAPGKPATSIRQTRYHHQANPLPAPGKPATSTNSPVSTTSPTITQGPYSTHSHLNCTAPHPLALKQNSNIFSHFLIRYSLACSSYNFVIIPYFTFDDQPQLQYSYNTLIHCCSYFLLVVCILLYFISFLGFCIYIPLLLMLILIFQYGMYSVSCISYSCDVSWKTCTLYVMLLPHKIKFIYNKLTNQNFCF